MERLDEAGHGARGASDIAIVGAGPAGLVAAIALARRGVRSTVFERDEHPDQAPRFNADRSYTIDITGYVDATSYFDERMLAFNGIQYRGRVLEGWDKPGWTGSRGDIVRTLMAVASDRHERDVDFRFQCPVKSVDVHTGTLTYASRADGTSAMRFGLVIGADGAGSVIRRAMQEQVGGFTVKRESIPNYVTMLTLDGVGDRMDSSYLHAMSIRHFYVAGAINGDDGPATARWFCARSWTSRRPTRSRGSARRRCSRTPSTRFARCSRWRSARTWSARPSGRTCHTRR